jgi:ANTAR domain
MTNIQLLRPSVFTLIEFAARAVGATGYSLLCADSAQIERGPRARYTIRGGGNSMATLEFSFLEGPIPQEKLAILRQMTSLIDAVQSLPHETSRRAARIARLDAELADIKIGERARGLLADGTPAAERVEAIVRHVKHVLRNRHLGAVFDRFLPEMEERVEERKLVMKAKAVLQEAHGMSEYQAYLHLRVQAKSSKAPSGNRERADS